MIGLTLRGKLVAFYEILAGLTGLVVAVPALFRRAPFGHETGYVLIGALLILASIVSLLAGIYLIKGKEVGLNLSFLIQTVQLPVLVLKGFHFNLFLLAAVTIGMNQAKEFMLNYYAGGRLILAVGKLEFSFMGLNILPLIILILLNQAFKKNT